MLKKQLMSTKNCDKPCDKLSIVTSSNFSLVTKSPPCSPDELSSRNCRIFLARCSAYSATFIFNIMAAKQFLVTKFGPKSSIVDLMTSCCSKVVWVYGLLTGGSHKSKKLFCLGSALILRKKLTCCHISTMSTTGRQNQAQNL
jgi:hypothetical protein